MTVTFAFVTFAWVFFRAADMQEATGYLKSAVTNFKQPKDLLMCLNVCCYVVPLIACDWWLRRDERRLHAPRVIKPVVYIVLSLLVLFYFGKQTNFIYFQF
jgi:hypothetical protein